MYENGQKKLSASEALPHDSPPAAMPLDPPPLGNPGSVAAALEGLRLLHHPSTQDPQTHTTSIAQSSNLLYLCASIKSLKFKILIRFTIRKSAKIREADTIPTDSVPTDAIPTICSQDDPVHL